VRGADLILACGDLPFEYLGYLMNGLDVPLVSCPGTMIPTCLATASPGPG
jgi:hypothetical protein